MPFHIITPIYGWTLNITLSWKVKVIYSRPSLSITPKWVVKSLRSWKIMVHTVENCPLSHLFEVCWPLKRKCYILELFLVVGKQSRKLCIRRLQPATTMSDRASLDFYQKQYTSASSSSTTTTSTVSPTSTTGASIRGQLKGREPQHDHYRGLTIHIASPMDPLPTT